MSCPICQPVVPLDFKPLLIVDGYYVAADQSQVLQQLAGQTVLSCPQVQEPGRTVGNGDRERKERMNKDFNDLL